MAKRKPKDPVKRLWLMRRVRAIKARASAIRATLHGRRYAVAVAVVLAVVAGAAYGGYAAWQRAKLRAITVASVDGQAITKADVFAEAVAEGMEPGRMDPAATKQVLDRVVERRVLVLAAARQGITTDERYRAARARADEMFLANLLMQRVIGGTPGDISDADARRFRDAHPAMFAQRQTFVLDAVTCALADIPDQPGSQFDTLAGTETYLRQAKLPYHRGTEVLDSADIPPEVAATLPTLAPGKVFILPRGRGALVAILTARIPSQLPVEAQLSAARNLLARKSMDDRMTNALAELKRKAKIEFVKQ